MKNLLIFSAIMMSSIMTFSQTTKIDLVTDSLETILFEKVNIHRISQGYKPITFSQKAYEVAKSVSRKGSNSDGVDLDSIFPNVGATYISNSTDPISYIDGTECSVSIMTTCLMNYWLSDIETEVFLIVHFDLGNGTDYSGAVGTVYVDGLYHHCLVIHESSYIK